MSSSDISIGNQIKKLRKKAGLSQYRVALKAGLTTTCISSLEQGVVTKPTIQTVIKIADALNLSLDELVGRDFREQRR